MIIYFTFVLTKQQQNIMYTTDTTIYANLALIGLLLIIMGIAYILYPSIKDDFEKFKDLN